LARAIFRSDRLYAGEADFAAVLKTKAARIDDGGDEALTEQFKIAASGRRPTCCDGQQRNRNQRDPRWGLRTKSGWHYRDGHGAPFESIAHFTRPKTLHRLRSSSLPLPDAYGMIEPPEIVATAKKRLPTGRR
jgi:hypothetical protein